MRTFSCFVKDERFATPILSFIFAESEERARQLARRELIETAKALSAEICENGRLVAKEWA